MNGEVLKVEGVLRNRDLLGYALGKLGLPCGLGRHKAEHLLLALRDISILNLNISLDFLSWGQSPGVSIDKRDKLQRSGLLWLFIRIALI